MSMQENENNAVNAADYTANDDAQASVAQKQTEVGKQDAPFGEDSNQLTSQS